MKQYTPMMQQYLKMKEGYQDALMFYRLGDFYEMFFEDAKIASSELDLVLTGRNAGVEEKVPMCGVPFHAVSSYIQRLVQRGYKVALVEQMEDAAETKGTVRRDVVKVYTPGTVVDTNEKKSVCLASISEDAISLTFAIVDCSTGETSIKRINKSWVQCIQLCLTHDIKELVVQDKFSEKGLKLIREVGNILVSFCEDTRIKPEYESLAERCKDDQYRAAMGLMLNYVEQTQKAMLTHLQVAQLENDKEVLKLDYSTLTNLELVDPQRPQGQSLWMFMDRCQSAMGSRLLKKWAAKPLVDLHAINNRLDQVQSLVQNYSSRNKLKESLSHIYDLQRCIGKISMNNANGQDCVRLQKTLQEVPVILNCLQDECFTKMKQVDPCLDLSDLLASALVDNPPVTIREGGMFKDGYNEELDYARKIQKEGRSWILELEAKEREKTGIKTLKIGFNRVFGYYIEVSKGQIGSILPEFGYIRKQTLTTGERYVTEELKAREDEILHAEERAIRLEGQLFQQLIDRIKTACPKLQKLALFLAEIDCINAMALLSVDHKYVRPTLGSRQIEIKAGKHPILDAVNKNKIISNDCTLTDDKCISIITGPNMGGKSTYMRMVACVCIMAQMGCFVPCKQAKLPIFDQIFTRIGASDDILSGQSTFMVEMNEANQAISHATANSLILFDEIGRGTSTYDGMSIAQAMIEYISTCIGAKTLFSTHYHELTALEETLDNVFNVHVEVHEENDEVTFMYKVKKGKADRSYGINVARLAKLPDSLLARAKDLCDQLQNNSRVVQQSYQIIEMTPTRQEDELLEMIRTLDTDDITPKQAHQILVELQEKVRHE